MPPFVLSGFQVKEWRHRRSGAISVRHSTNNYQLYGTDIKYAAKIWCCYVASNQQPATAGELKCHKLTATWTPAPPRRLIASWPLIITRLKYESFGQESCQQRNELCTERMARRESRAFGRILNANSRPLLRD